MSRKAIIYVRESTKEQDWESQLLECREYAKRHDLSILKEYVDQMSGARNDRKGFLELQGDIEKRSFDVLILWELSRMTRDFITYRIMFQSLQEADIEMHSLQEGILSTDDDIDKNFGTDLLALLGERERKVLGRRIKIRKQTMRESGKWTGGRAPFGYSNREAKLYIDSDAPKVREIFDLYIKGMGYTEIAKRFGIYEGRQVKRIIQNPIYIGKIQLATEMVNGKRKKIDPPKLTEGEHEAIIDEDTFYLANRMARRNLRKSHKEKYLLDNVYCQCGERVYPAINRYGFLHYTCRGRLHWHRGQELEDQVIKALEKQFESFELEESDPNNPLTRIALYEDELEKVISKEKNLTKKYLEEKISDEVFNSFAKELKENRVDIQMEIDYLRNTISKPKEIRNKELMKKYFHKLKTTEDRIKVKQILNLIIHEVRYVNSFRAVVITNLI